jgi:osmotically-inducible protein OsmY
MHRKVITGHWLAMVGAGLLALSPGVALAAPDAWITAKTKLALLTADNVSGTSINVDTVDGRVTLHGTVRTAEEKAKAEMEARKIDGVKEVRNLLQVVPGGSEAVKASDAEIKDRVSKALNEDKTLDDISVQSVNNGVVLLAGNADSVSEHLRAVTKARAVPGVKKVASEIKSPDKLADAEIRRERESAEAGVKRGAGETATDMWITTATKMRLLANDKTPAMDINVDTHDGTVVLFGAVPSADAKAAAEAEARKVSGVKRVENKLEIVASAKKDAVEAKDEDLKDAIENSLAKRDDLKDADIDVEVKNGVARLTGSVDDEHDRLAAAIAARSTPGVRAVQDELRYKDNK